VVRFEFPESLTGQSLKVPHMGWNQISYRGSCPLFKDISQDAYVYFVHSYHVVTIRDEIVAATTDYGYTFTSAVWSGNIFATQFHPEKSQDVGLKMLENFVAI
jgi:glutamine amidotransferase